MRSRRVAAASLLALGLASVFVIASLRSPDTAASAAPAPTTSSTTTSSTTTTSTTTPPTSTTTLAVGGEAPPPVDLQADTFDELRLVWDQIDAYWAWLNAHPTDDPTVLAVIFHPDGVEFARQMEGYTAIKEVGLRVLNSGPGEVISFAHPDPQANIRAGAISIGLITSDLLGAQVVDDSGQIVQVLGGWDKRQWRIHLVRIHEGSWLVWSLERA